MTARWTLGKMQNPVRGFLHGSAATAGMIGTVLLAAKANGWQMRTASLVFGMGIVALYTTSALYHSIPWRRVWKMRMQRLDHSMIYILIASTFTPVTIAVLESPLRWVGLLIVWAIAVAGVLQKAFTPRVPRWFSVALSTTLGWLGLFLVWPLLDRLGVVAMVLVLIGGVLYTVGMVLLVTNRPRLWPRVFSYHELFHVLVVSATSVHFLAVWRYVVTAGR